MSTAKRRKLHDGSAQATVSDAYRPPATEADSSKLLVWSSANVLARALPSNGTSLTCLLSRLPGPHDKSLQPARLSIPIRRAAEEIHLLSFSPKGQHLLVTTRFPQGQDPSLLTHTSAGLRLVLFEQGVSACWQDWQILHEWIIETAGLDASEVADLQWVDESPSFGLPLRAGEPYVAAPKPGFSVSDGSAFVVVLSSDEMLFCRFDSLVKAPPLLLRTSLSAKSTTTLIMPAPPLNEAIPASFLVHPASAALGIAVGSLASATVSHAAICFPPKESCILVAAQLRRRPTCRPIAEPITDIEDVLSAVVQDAPLSALSAGLEDDAQNLLNDFDLGAFTGLGSLENLDEAFGDLEDIVKDDPVVEGSSKIGVEPDLTLDAVVPPSQNDLAMFAVKVDLLGEAGPTIDVERLPDLPLLPESKDSDGSEELAHLIWLRRDQKDAGLTLVAISNAHTRSYATQWRAEYASAKLCQAFETLHGKKSKESQSEKSWHFLPATEQTFEGRTVLSIQRSAVSPTEAFLHALEPVNDACSLIAIDAVSLPRPAADLHKGFRHLALSATSCVLAAVDERGQIKIIPRPGGPASAEDIGARLALNIRRQRDSSDLFALLGHLKRGKGQEEQHNLGFQTLKAMVEHLQAALQIEAPLRTNLAPILLQVQYGVLSVCGTKMRQERSHSILRLWAIAANFTEACIPSRSGGPAAYNLSAAWPLIASVTWYVRFVTRLLRALADYAKQPAASSQDSSELFLLVHPFCLAAHRTLAKQIGDFGGFFERYNAPIEDAVFPIARTVLLDNLTGAAPGTIPFKAWQTLLLGLSQPESALPASTPLMALDLPDTLPDGLRLCGQKAAEMLAMLEPTQVKDKDAQSDVVTFARLSSQTASGVRRSCTRCGGISELSTTVAGSVEARWRTRCICGGSWSLVSAV